MTRQETVLEVTPDLVMGSMPIAHRYAHLSGQQRRKIYLEFQALIEAHSPSWPRHSEMSRLRQRQAEKYGVHPYIIMRVYNHARWVERHRT